MNKSNLAQKQNQKRSSDSKSKLRLWIQLLRTTRVIETELRENLRREYDVTLPRFDVMAALYRQRKGMLMSELSRFLMVSNGNVTGIVDRLVADALVVRALRNGDRRTSIVKLTRKGIKHFEEMATVHERWIDELMSEISDKEATSISNKLKKLGD